MLLVKQDYKRWEALVACDDGGATIVPQYPQKLLSPSSTDRSLRPGRIGRRQVRHERSLPGLDHQIVQGPYRVEYRPSGGANVHADKTPLNQSLLARV